MYQIKLKVQPCARKSFSFIDFECLEQALNVVVNQLVHEPRVKRKTVKVLYTKGDNAYIFKQGKIYISDLSEIKLKEYTFIKVFLHEFKHWIQDVIYKVSYTRNYVDCTVNYRAYLKCPIERDSRRFSNQLFSNVRGLYNQVKKLKSRIDAIKNDPIVFNA